MKKLNLIGFCIFLIFVNILDVYAIGVSPGRKIIDYNPDGPIEFDIRIHNQGGEEKEVSILIKGDLEKYLKPETREVKFNEGEEIKTIHLVLDLPLDISPGRKEGIIEITEKPDKNLVNEGVSVVAQLQVLSQVIVDIPIQGKYINLDVNINQNQLETQFLANIKNTGNEDADNVYLTIQIYKENSPIKELKSDAFSLNKDEIKTVNLNTSLEEGDYEIVFILTYDDKKNVVRKEFSIKTERNLDVIDVGVSQFILGGIAKFEILVENTGKYNIDGLIAKMEIYSLNGNKISEINSDRISINSNQQSKIDIYWDTKDIPEGSYKSKLILTYSDKVLQRDLELKVEKNRIKANLLTGGAVKKIRLDSTKVSIIVLIFILLIIVNVILYFLRYRKKWNIRF